MYLNITKVWINFVFAKQYFCFKMIEYAYLRNRGDYYQDCLKFIYR